MIPVNRTGTFRIGFLTDQDVTTPNSASGMIESSYRALLRQRSDMVLLDAGEKPARFQGRLKQQYNSFMKRLRKASAYDQEIKQARRIAKRARSLIERTAPDLIISPFSGRCLFENSFSCPIIYASDATSQLMVDTNYFVNRSEGFCRALIDIERDFSSRVSAAAFASHATLESATADFHYPRNNSMVIPLGANLIPPIGWKASASLPTSQDVSILLIAADVVRKRLDLCISTMEILRRRGVNAHLHLVGGKPPDNLRNHSGFTYHGFLDRSHHQKRQHLIDLFTTSHLLMLPSAAEMFGIAPAEAAHFARPSLVSNIGGLPTVVQNGKTGFVLPSNAGPDDYAEKIIWWINHPDDYTLMRNAAQKRAARELTWDSWARGTLGMLKTS